MGLRNVTAVTDEIMDEILERLIFGLECKKREVYHNAKGIAVIRRGQFSYTIFNVCFVHDMLSAILECLYLGYIPMIELEQNEQNTIQWEDYFLQPFYEYPLPTHLPRVDFEDISPGFLLSFMDYDFVRVKMQGQLLYAEMAMRMYRDYLHLNGRCATYCEQEYAHLLAGKRVLGVVARGTDMDVLKLTAHPIQPPVEDIIAYAKCTIEECNLDAVYVASEEKRIVARFQEAFPGKVIVNRRKYYDDAYYDTLGHRKDARVTDIALGMEGSHSIKGLEYLSSLMLLSRCNAFGGVIVELHFSPITEIYINMSVYRFLIWACILRCRVVEGARA